MKTFTILIFFSLFLGLSAFMNEYSLTLFKNFKEQTTQSDKVSFVFGWVEYQGKTRFFIQENHWSIEPQKAGVAHPFDTQSTQTLQNALQKACKGCRVISFKQAHLYDDLMSMNLAKEKLLTNKKSVFKISLPTSFYIFS